MLNANKMVKVTLNEKFRTTEANKQPRHFKVEIDFAGMTPEEIQDCAAGYLRTQARNKWAAEGEFPAEDGATVQVLATDLYRTERKPRDVKKAAENLLTKLSAEEMKELLAKFQAQGTN